MARTPTQPTAPAELIQVAPQAEQQLAALQDSALTQQQMDEVLAAGIDLGRLEAMDFVATIANSAILAIYENVKKSKAWRLLRNPESGDGRHFESLDEFCEVKLGKSYKRLRELTFNRNLIGQEAFEQAERLGLRQRDYNAIKALPAPDQELVRRAVEEAQSRDEVLDLLQELVVRHAKEKEQLAAQAQADRAALEAKDRVLADNATKINEQDVEIELLKNAPFVPREGSVARTRQEQALLDEVFRTSLRLAPRMKKLLLAADAAMGGQAPEAVQHAARAAVQFVAQQLADMARELNIALDLDRRVEAPWTEADAAALATLEARNAAAEQ